MPAAGCQPPAAPDKPPAGHSSKEDAQSARAPGQDHEVDVKLKIVQSIYIGQILFTPGVVELLIGEGKLNFCVH